MSRGGHGLSTAKSLPCGESPRARDPIALAPSITAWRLAYREWAKDLQSSAEPQHRGSPPFPVRLRSGDLTMPPHHVKVPGPKGWRGWRLGARGLPSFGEKGHERTILKLAQIGPSSVNTLLSADMRAGAVRRQLASGRAAGALILLVFGRRLGWWGWSTIHLSHMHNSGTLVHLVACVLIDGHQIEPLANLSPHLEVLNQLSPLGKMDFQMVECNLSSMMETHAFSLHCPN